MVSTALVLAASMAVGQAAIAAEQTKDAAPQVTDLAWLLGEWRGEYILPEGVSEVGPAGSKVLSMQTWRRTLDKRFITLKIREEIDGRVASTGEEILGTDQNTGALAHWFFGSTGVHGSGTWRRNGDRWELKWRAAAPGGKKYEAIGDHVQIDADTYTWQLRDMSENGNKIPDWPKVRYHRRKTSAADDVWKAYRDAAAGTWEGKSYVTRGADSWQWQMREQTHDGEEMPDTPLATFQRKAGSPAGDLWNAYQKAAAGKWVGEGQLLWDVPQYQASKSNPFKLQLSLQEEMQGKVLVGNQEFQVKTKTLSLPARIVAGWDPDSQQIRLFAFWSDGFVEELFFSRREGSKFFGTYASKAPGSPAERWPICLQFPNPDSYEYTFLSGPHKGKVLSSWKREK